MTSAFLTFSWPVTLIDAALRSLLMAAAVGVGLRVLRVNNVRARKVAWVLVLTGAMFMPLLAPWAESHAWLPVQAAIVPAQTWLDRIAELRRSPKQQNAAQPGSIAFNSGNGKASVGDQSIEFTSSPAVQIPESPALSSDHFPSPSVSANNAGQTSEAARPPSRKFPSLSPRQIGFLAYAVITLALLARLGVGLFAAIRLWAKAEPVEDSLTRARGLRVRASRAVSSPVTVGSSILLPARYKCWEAEKLRIVLAHESSHVRQGDFYLQLFAAIYAALFWFSPLGWWLKRTLCDLSEAISDGEAVSHAASHASYAQILLEFAAMPRTTRIGVAMAREGRLSHRIERLLDESRFRGAFAGGRGRILIAALLAPLALFAATSLIRVQAAGQEPVPPPAPTAPAAPADADLPATPEVATAPEPAAEPDEVETIPVPAAAPGTPAAPGAPAALAPPATPATPAAVATPSMPPTPPGSSFSIGASTGAGESYSMAMAQTNTRSTRGHRTSSSYSANGQHYSYSYSNDGESYALISANDKEHIQFSGDWMEGRREELNKARSIAHGDFLWFTRNGKSYVVDDPSIVAGLMAAYKPMEDLGRQQEELGRQQEELGQQQEKMAERMTQATIPTPDLTKEMAELNSAVAELNAAKGKTVTQEQLAELEEKLGEIQGKIGGLQGEMGAHQGEIGALQGKIGAQQGELGAKQGRIGAEQGRIARQADRKVKGVIDQSLKDGKARPVQ